MRTEFEIRFLDINKDDFRKLLEKVGGILAHPELLMRRAIFDSDVMKSNSGWLRLRDEGNKVTLTYKQSSSDLNLGRMKEIEVEVSSFGDCRSLLSTTGLLERTYQENLRETWDLLNVSVTIDTWPSIGTLVEFEGKDEETIKKAVFTLGLDWSAGTFDSIDEIYKRITGKDIKYIKEVKL
jgi:adenylate cyclase class 2